MKKEEFDSREIIQAAQHHARAMNAPYVLWRHVMLAMLDEPEGREALERLDVSVTGLSRDIKFSLLAAEMGAPMIDPVSGYITISEKALRNIPVDIRSLIYPKNEIAGELMAHLFVSAHLKMIRNANKGESENIRTYLKEYGPLPEDPEVLKDPRKLKNYFLDQYGDIQEKVVSRIKAAELKLRQERLVKLGMYIGANALDNVDITQDFRERFVDKLKHNETVTASTLWDNILADNNSLLMALLYRNGLLVPNNATEPAEFMFPPKHVMLHFLAAWEDANQRRARTLTVDHLLPSLLSERLTSQTLIKLGYKHEVGGPRLHKMLQESADRENIGQGYRRGMMVDVKFKEMLRTASELQPESRPVLASDIMALLIQDENTGVAAKLKEWGVEKPADFAQTYAKLLADLGQDAQQRSTLEMLFGMPMKAGEALNNYTVDMTDRARQGKYDPVLGRDAEITQLADILMQRKKPNATLVGDAGVGKSAIAEGLALRIAAAKVPKELLNVRLLYLDSAKLVAGTRYRGDFEERMQAVIAGASADKSIVLFIDEAHSAKGAGTAEGAASLGELLKPALARGEIRVITATTWDEYRKYIEKDHAFSRRFQLIKVEEPSIAQTRKVLAGIAPKYEKHYGAKAPQAVIDAIVAATSRYIQDRRQPDKSLDILDVVLQQVASAGRKVATVRDVQKIIALRTGIPLANVTAGNNSALLTIGDDLSKAVIAQEEPCRAIGNAVKRGVAGIRDPKKPIGCFLFMGPTGVGKTLTVKKLAQFMGLGEPVRIDMSEYMEKHTVSRLIGAPPGYVGYEEPGQLTEPVRRRPFSVVLLDEIEKAHPDVMAVLLQVLDDGRLTDSMGRTIDFTNTIIVATSNIGAREAMVAARGFGFKQHKEITDKIGALRAKYLEELEKWATPEFINRFSEIVVFNPLTPDVMPQIVDLELKSLKQRLAERKVTVDFAPDVLALLAEKGYDFDYGARPLKRVIVDMVETPLSSLVLARKGGKQMRLTAAINKEGRKDIVFVPAVGPPATRLAAEMVNSR